MKRFCVLFLAVIMLQGCISMGSIRNTTNRLQGDITYFQDQLTMYSVLFEGNDASDKAMKALSDAKNMLVSVEQATGIGDKVSEKKYLSALVDIMDILERHGAEK